MVLTGAGAAANAPDSSAPAAIEASFSTPAAIDAYLRSVGVDPASVVKQSGRRNYAGPNCPGREWTCTKSTRVLQVATGDGQNKVDCPNGSDVSTSTEQKCVVVQSGSHNVAKCQQRSDSAAAVQYCSITQTGRKNVAHVHQTVHASESTVQTATQTAVVMQTTAGGANDVNVHQQVKQSTKDGSAQTQDAQQSAEVDQDATGSGDNALQIHQDQDLSAKGSAADQNQNTSGLGLPDCASGFPFTPNACARVDQSSVDGDNKSHLKQSIKEDAKTDVMAVQRQGAFNGGVDGKVHQETVSGSSRNEANQDKRQRLSGAPGSSQTQFDPLSCCGLTSQVGGTDNVEQIDQSSSQDASEASAFQELALLGESSTPTGTCTVTQHAQNSSDSTTNSASLSPCPFLQVFTTCTSGGETGGDFVGRDEIGTQQEGEAGCTAFTPVTNPPECTQCELGSVIPLIFARPNG